MTLFQNKVIASCFFDAIMIAVTILFLKIYYFFDPLEL